MSDGYGFYYYDVDIFDNCVYENATLYVPATIISRCSDIGPFSTIVGMTELNLTYDNACGYVFYNGKIIQSPFELNLYSATDKQCSFMIFPKEGYCIDAIDLNGNNTFTAKHADNSYDVCVNDDIFANSLDIRFRKVGEATLTVSSPGHHTANHSYPEGSTPSVTLEPQPGWSLHSVTLNDKHMELNDENKISIPAISGHNNLNAIYIEDTTDLDAVELGNAAPVTVTLSGHILIVDHKPAEASVQVYDIAGNLVVSTTDNELYLPMKNEVAIIKVAGNVYKTVVR